MFSSPTIILVFQIQEVYSFYNLFHFTGYQWDNSVIEDWKENQDKYYMISDYLLFLIKQIISIVWYVYYKLKNIKKHAKKCLTCFFGFK